MEKPVEISNLTVVYKGRPAKKAVENLNLEVFKGEIFGFLGPNGAGKTTTIKAMIGLLYPDRGNISILGRSPQDPRSRIKVGYMPELATYSWYLTPRELLRMYGAFFHLDKVTLKKRIEDLLALVDLKDMADVLMSKFSKGMMQKVSLVQSLINDPELLLLDEPTGGLDPISRITMRDLLKKLKSRGKTIFFSSHELSEVELISDRIAILKKGKMERLGKLKELLEERGEYQSLEQYFLSIIGEG